MKKNKLIIKLKIIEIITKTIKIKKNKNQDEKKQKITHYKLGLKCEIKKKMKLLWKSKGKKLKIITTRIKSKTSSIIKKKIELAKFFNVFFT